MSNGIGSVLMVANCDYTDPREPARQYRARTTATTSGYWSISLRARPRRTLDALLLQHERAAYLKDQLGTIPGTDINFFGDESTHEVAWRAVGTRRDEGPSWPDAAVRSRCASLRMWDLFRPGRTSTVQRRGSKGRGLWQSRLATFQYFPLLARRIVGLVILRRRRVPDPAVPRDRDHDHDHGRDDVRHHALPRAGRRDAARARRRRDRMVARTHPHAPRAAQSEFRHRRRHRIRSRRSRRVRG